jgi:hypothetical protein
VQANSDRDETFTVTNTGCGTLSGSVSMISEQFGFGLISGTTFKLGPGQSQTVTVRFRPRDLPQGVSALEVSESAYVSSDGGAETITFVGVIFRST